MGQEHTPPQDRRSFLRWAVHGLGAIFALVLGVPAVAYLIDGRNRKAPPSGFRRLARLSELTPNQPREYTIRQTRQDAWTLYPNEIVGRVFLIRRDGDQVEAFTTTCPHLGCSINFTGNAAVPFLCPCHGGHWTIQGQRIDPENNVAPRDMDTLQTQRTRVPGTPDSQPDYFIEVHYQSFKALLPNKEPRA
jgi:menaquinol-cytochrome c reductase iron-sulfur subunit